MRTRQKFEKAHQPLLADIGEFQEKFNLKRPQVNMFQTVVLSSKQRMIDGNICYRSVIYLIQRSF